MRLQVQDALGPSPRVRGAAGGQRGHGRCPGTIPAGAGSRDSPTAAWPTAGDHPRGCGEQTTAHRSTLRDEGPSPRVRGAGVAVPARGARVGTIPAGAGSREFQTGAEPAGWDHPRGCGEQTQPQRQPQPLQGPSPRVRGAGIRRRRPGRRRGTIPAGAGSRSTTSGRSLPARDHPRGCGEQPQPGAGNKTIAGPSPRVRGAGAERVASGPLPGTIPAGAGSSPRRS